VYKLGWGFLESTSAIDGIFVGSIGGMDEGVAVDFGGLM
jgi:hypothetical protein